MNILDAVQADPSTWTKQTWNVLCAAYDAQHASVYQCVGGFINPVIECFDEDSIEFRCYYNNYDNDGYDLDSEYCEEKDDSWHFTLSRKTGEFDR